MSAASRKPVALVVALVVIAGLGAGGWFGYRAVLAKRAALAVEAAADFERSARSGDTQDVKDLLPPEVAEELGAEGLDMIAWEWGTTWAFVERDGEGTDISDTYETTPSEYEDAEMTIEWEIEDATLTRATVVGTAEWDDGYGEEYGCENTFELVWLDGSWRLARWECSEGDDDIVFWDVDEDPDDLAQDFMDRQLENGFDEDWADSVSGAVAPELTEEQMNAELPEGHPLAEPGLTEDEMDSGELPEGHPDIGGMGSGLYADPEDVVIAYGDAVMRGDYATAYHLLPADTKAGMTEAAFTAQIAGYDITGFSITSVANNGDTALVAQEATMPGGTFVYYWDLEWWGNTWIATGREIGTK